MSESPAIPAGLDVAALRRLARAWWVEAAIVLLALIVRTVWLDLKPPHFDEGVNGWFVDQMTAQGCYHYDPTNFHGPLHFYLLFLAQTLLGRHAWALRLPVVLFSTAAVALTCAFRRFWHPHTCRLAAFAMALSPAMTFYARYAIHESELLVFLLLALWGLLGLARDGDSRSLRAVAIGATGCILTKETYAIHFVAFALAWPALLLLERLLRFDSLALAHQRWARRDALTLAGLGIGAIIFFYSGALQSWGDLAGVVTTFHTWVATGTKNTAGQEKEWWYWFQLLGTYEWPAAFGFLAAFWFAFAKATDRALRFTIIYGLGAFTAYALVPYKTPWCLLSIMWPFFFTCGEALRRLGPWLDRPTVATFAVLLFGQSGWSAAMLNFQNYTDEEEPYVYVQTLPGIHRILDPLRRLVSLDPAQRYLSGYLLLPPGDGHPLPWLMAEYPEIISLNQGDAKPMMDADILLVSDQYVSDMQERLYDRYFRESVVVRGQAGGEATFLYLRAGLFAPLFPGREPEFDPTTRLEPPPASQSGSDTPPPSTP